MNKKIASEIAVGIVLFLAIVIGGIFWIQNKKVQVVVTQPILPIEQTQRVQNLQQIIQADEVIINRGERLEKINIETRIISSVKNPRFDDLSNYSGLPKEFINEKNKVINEVAIVSEDESQMLVFSNTYDQTVEPSVFDGSLQILNSEEFVCDVLVKKCLITKMIASAYELIDYGGKWYDHSNLWWFRWDSAENLFYGHLTGEGVGDAAPVYIYNANSNTYKKTIGYDSIGEGKMASVPAGAFSPSLKKFIMIDENVGLDDNENAKFGSWDFLLYDAKNLSEPIKKINISQMQKDGSEYGSIGSVTWSQDENMLAVATDGQIFTLDLVSGLVELRYSYVSKEDNSEWFDFNKIDLSQSGRYITFFTSEKAKKGEKADSNNNVGVLKTIDLKNNNIIMEIMRDADMSLIY